MMTRENLEKWRQQIEFIGIVKADQTGGFFLKIIKVNLLEICGLILKS